VVAVDKEKTILPSRRNERQNSKRRRPSPKIHSLIVLSVRVAGTNVAAFPITEYMDINPSSLCARRRIVGFSIIEKRDDSRVTVNP
jgi:hypothetical protein